MLRDLVIYGSGGHAREMHQLVRDLNAEGPRFNLLGFLDHNPDLHGQPVHDAEILGDEAFLDGRPKVQVVVAIGSPAVRRRVVAGLEARGHRSFATLIHPAVPIGREVTVGEGAMIGAGSVLTDDIRVGRHVIVNVGCTVSHDVVLEDFATLAPGVHLAGAVEVGEGAEVGIASTCIQGLRIGAWSVVGAGAAVVRNVPANATAVGVPAKVIKERPDGWQLA